MLVAATLIGLAVISLFTTILTFFAGSGVILWAVIGCAVALIVRVVRTRWTRFGSG